MDAAGPIGVRERVEIFGIVYRVHRIDPCHPVRALTDTLSSDAPHFVFPPHAVPFCNRLSIKHG